MNARQTIKKIASLKAASIVATVLVVAVAAFSVIVTMNPAAGDESMTIRGPVASIDGYNRIFSVRGAEGNITMSTDKSTSFTLCTMNRGFESLAAGQEVTVTYHEHNGSLIADAVDIAPVVLACYNEE